MSGYLSNPAEALDLILSHFFLANASQTVIYRGEVKTAQSILQQYSSDIPAAAAEMEVTLTRLLSKYFTEVTVSVTSKVKDSSQSASVMEFIVSGFVVDGDNRIQMSKVAELNNSVFVKFVEANNG